MPQDKLRYYTCLFLLEILKLKEMPGISLLQLHISFKASEETAEQFQHTAATRWGIRTRRLFR
jgi:uncharacterized protein YecE (DUF72 family)